MLQKINLAVITLLSISAGLAKVMLMPQEVQFFENAGLGESTLLIFGLAQIIAGILLIIKNMRKWGAIFVAVMFILSTVMILSNGMIGFGIFSILPIVLTGFIIKNNLQKV